MKVYFSVFLLWLLSVPGMAQIKVVGRTTPVHPPEVIRLAREAIGNTNIQSLSAEGKIRRRVKYVEVSSPTKVEEKEKILSSKIEIDFVFPDKFRVREKGSRLNGQSYEFVAIVNGAESWIHPQPVVPSTAENRRVVSVEDAEQSLIRQAQAARASVSRFTLAWLLKSWKNFPYEFQYVGQINAELGKHDVVSVQDADGYKLLLMLNPESHLPVMINETIILPQAVTVIPKGFGFDRRYNRAIIMKAREERIARFKQPQPISIQMRLLDRQDVGGITVPHLFKVYHNNQEVEEIEFSEFKLNHSINLKKFEENRPK